MLLYFHHLRLFGPAVQFIPDFLQDTIVFVLYLEKFHVYFPFKRVGEVVIEGVGEHSVDEFLNQID